MGEKTHRVLPTVLAPAYLGCLGAWANNLWITQISQPFVSSESNLGQQYLLTALPAIPMLVLLIVLLWRHRNIKIPAAVDWAFCAIMLLGSLFMNTSYTESFMSTPYAGNTVALIACAIGVSCGFSWLWIRWGMFYASIDLINAGTCILLAFVIGALFNIPLVFIPRDIVFPVVFLLPVLSLLFLRGAMRNPPADNLPRDRQLLYTKGSMLPVWRVAICLFACNVLLMLGNQYVDVPTSFEVLTGQYAITALICLLLVYIVCVRRARVDFMMIWALLLVLIALSLLLLAFQGTPLQMSWLNTRIMFEVSHRLVEILSLFLFADLAQHTDLHPLAVFSIALLTRLIVVSFFSLFNIQASAVGSNYMIPTLLFCIIILIYFVHSRQSDFKLMLQDLQEPHTAPEGFSGIRERCEQIGQTSGLTEREIEVMDLLCQGRSKAYIGETLYISESTVKGHTRHIYTKLGIHNRTELQKIVGV